MQAVHIQSASSVKQVGPRCEAMALCTDVRSFAIPQAAGGTAFHLRYLCLDRRHVETLLLQCCAQVTGPPLSTDLPTCQKLHGTISPGTGFFPMLVHQLLGIDRLNS